MTPEVQKIILSKDRERRRLRELPWIEKLEMLDRLRDRHLWIQQTKPIQIANIPIKVP